MTCLSRVVCVLNHRSCPISALQVPESVAEASMQWVRFSSSDPPLVLEAPLQIQAAPADPASWTIRCICV